MQNDSIGADAGTAHSPYDAWLKMCLALLTCFPLMCQASETCAPALVGAEENPPTNQQPITPPVPPNAASAAVKAAIADGVTTGIAVASGAVELNPLVTPTPMGLLALTGVKVAVVRYGERLPEHEKRMVMKTTTSLWSGAAANNMMVLIAAPPPFPLLAGLAIAYIGWQHMARGYEEYDRIVALQAKPAPAVTLAECNEAPTLGHEVAVAR